MSLAKRPAQSPSRAQRPLAPAARPIKETLSAVIGRSIPQAAAGFGLGLANGSALGKKVEELTPTKLSRGIAAGLAVAKGLGIDNISPIAGKICSAGVESEINDISRSLGERTPGWIGNLLDSKAETKTSGASAPVEEKKPVTDTTGIEVKEVAAKSNGAANGVSQPTAPKVTHEKNPSANA